MRTNNSQFTIFNLPTFKSFFVLILFLLISFTTFSQEINIQETLEDLIEEIASNSDEELDYTMLYEDLNFYYNQPLNLNEATAEDLEKLHFLNALQIQSILDYREKAGKMLTIYELQLLDGFEQSDIRRLLPFVTVVTGDLHRKTSLKNALKYGRHQVFIRNQFIVQEQAGYNISDSVLAENPDKNRYLGDRMKYYMKYKYSYRNKLLWGLTMEKDPGEEFFTGNQKFGFDYYSGHVQLNDVWKFKTIVVGDYALEFGQGLAMWTGMGFGKSSMALNIKKRARGIKKYSSTNENQFMRGTATTLSLGKFDITGFYSFKNIDANIDDSDSIDDSEIRQITSLQITGYHRTPNEFVNKHAIQEMIYGGHVAYRGNKFKTGLTFVKTHLSADLQSSLKPYSQFYFQGSDIFNVSLDYQFLIKDIYVFGEAAVSDNGGLAFLNGALIPLAPRISLATLHRYYQKDYQAYYKNAFAESSRIANEHGLYFGTEIYPIKHWKISAYFDAYSFPWLKSRANSPTYGQEYLVQLDYNPTRYVKMYWRFKREIKPENISDDEITIKYAENVDKYSVRYQIVYKLTRYLRFANRVELSRYNKGGNLENGYLIYQDVQFKPERIPLSLSFRYAIFDAPYNARLYAYENDVLYAFSVPGYFYKGYRTYLTLKYDISNRITIWLRYAQFSYADKSVISENSLSEISGNTKSEVKIQLRIKLN